MMLSSYEQPVALDNGDVVWFNSTFTEYKFCTIPTDGTGEPSITISDSEQFDESFIKPTPTPPPTSTITPTPTPKPTPTPASVKVASISKQDYNDIYSFKITVTSVKGTVIGYAALYDTDGRLLSVKSTTIKTGVNSIEVEKSPRNAYAKVFVWGENLRSFTDSKSYVLTPTETAATTSMSASAGFLTLTQQS